MLTVCRILKEIGKGERIALAKLAVEHLERTQRPLRIAIDAAIWNFQSQAGQGGKNPALRTLYYRLLRLLALPIHPLFVYDGKNKPLIKRGRAVSRWGTCIANETSKKLVNHFKFPCHVAPGEAEAECALLQKRGIVDMVMSQDGDAIMFGSQLTLRDWSKEGTRGNKSPTHVNLLDLPRLKERSGLDPDGMILVALLSGGDYDQDGVAGFGAGLASEAARAGFGTDLLELVRNDDEAGLQEWRERLQYELETNESGFFKRRHKTLKIPDSFPDRSLVGYYVNPAVSKEEDLPRLERRLSKTWNEDIDIPEFRQYAGETFDWLYKPGAWKFVRSMAPSLLAHKLHRGFAEQYVTSVDQIRERRQHFTSDGMPEMRVVAVPADVVGLDLEAEEDSPEFLARLAEEQELEDGANEVAVANDGVEENEEISASQQAPNQRKSPPWNPNEPEKMWIPETVVQLGVPALVEEWHQRERDRLADPKKFAARKCKKATAAGTRSQASRIDRYFGTSKVTTASKGIENSIEADPGPRPVRKEAAQPGTPTKKRPETSLPSSSPDIKHFFRVTKLAHQVHQPGPLKSAADSIKLLEVARKHTGPPDLDLFAEEEPILGHPVQENTSESQTNIVAIMFPPSRPDRGNALHSAPSTPQKVASANLVEDEDELPDSVTRRKRRTRIVKTKAQQKQPIQRSKTLESFFQSEDDDGISQLPGPPEPLVPIEQEVPTELSTGLQADFLRKKVHALPRESLPGTWKAIELNEEVMSVKSKRTTRVSYVDLAKD